MDFDFTKPHKIVNGEPVPLAADELAAKAAEEKAWLAAQPKVQVLAQLSSIDTKLNAQRWAREGILGLGELINILRSCPPTITTVADLVAWLQSIPAPGTGMAKLQAVEDSAKALRTQLSQLP